MISIIRTAGYSDTSVALRSGHRDVRSILLYNKRQGELGCKQILNFIGGASCVSKEEQNIEN